MERKVIKIFGAQDNIQAEMILETLGNNQIPAYKKGVGSSDIMNIYGGNSRTERIYMLRKRMRRRQWKYWRGWG